jgi:hypothetical protein
MASARPWYRLSLPGTTSFPAFNVPPANDPLLCWPDKWSAADATQWHDAMAWDDVPGYSAGVKADVGFEQSTVNYAFNYCFGGIPSRSDGESPVLLFDLRQGKRGEDDFRAKQRYFYAALKYGHQYPRKQHMKSVLSLSQSTFSRFVKPTVYQCARRVDFIDWALRMWDYNHTEHFPERVLTSFDGFPLAVCGSKNKWVRRLTKSKKYQTYVLKCDLGVMIGPGFIVNYAGPQLGVRNDARMWLQNRKRRKRMHPWEYALGDKMYDGCPEFLTEFKDYGSLDSSMLAWNDMLQFYRGRNEHAVSEVKNGRAALDTRWRGSYAGLCAIVRLLIHMTALEQRMLGPRYDVFGPWPVCPDQIVAQYV